VKAYFGTPSPDNAASAEIGRARRVNNFARMAEFLK